jgi:membrane protease YdiL (CAAX protease family)
MILFDHLLAIVLVVIGPLRSGSMGLQRFRSAAPDALPRLRRHTYRAAIAMQWSLVLATGLIWFLARRPLADLGLEPRLGGGLIGVGVGLAIIVVVMIRERHRAIADPDGLAEIRARLEPLRFLLPHTRDEFGLFSWVALTAGSCEELLYRGYLIWYFSHALPWWAAALAAAVAFGFGHAYQGPRGVVVGTILGGFLAAVYFLTGSLYAPMVFHALMDLHTGDLAWRAYAREREETAVTRRDAAVGPVAGVGGTEPGVTSAITNPESDDAA